MSTDIEPKADLTSIAIASLGWKAEQIDVIRKSVAKDATLPELYQFLYLCKAYDLDPFKREIYFMKDDKGRSSIITGIDGFRKAAKRDPHYKGVQAFAVKEGDEFSVDAAAYTVIHKFGAKRGRPLGAWARADAEGRLPVILWVDFDEFNKKTFTWNLMPGVMIAKVAESHAIRRQFGLAGLYTKEEMGVSDTTLPTPTEAAPIVDANYTEPEPAEEPPAQEPVAEPAEQAKPIDTIAKQSIGDKPTGNGKLNFAGFYSSAKNLGFDETAILADAGAYFNIPALASLKDVPELDARRLGAFLLHLRDIAGKPADRSALREPANV